MAFSGKRLENAINHKQITRSILAYRLGVDRSYITNYINGKYKPRDEMVSRMAEILGVSQAWLSGYDVPMIEEEPFVSGLRRITRQKLPMLGNVACGEPIFADEHHESFVDTNADLDADFCLTAKGDSMINARIFDGDILFVKEQPMVDDGEIAVVLIDDEATVKRVYYDREEGVLTLMPENPIHKPMRYTGDRLNSVRILGKVVFGQYVIS